MNYSFLIGVEKYLGDIEDLYYIENDVNEMSEALGNINYTAENQHICINEHATKAWIESQLKQLTSIIDKNDDSIIFYFAGHGVSYNGTNFLLCYDTDKNNISDTAISINYIFDLLGKHCNKVILLLDACHSGLNFDGLSRGLTSSISDIVFKQKCKENEYWVILSACKENEESNPIKDYQHGTWTYHLIQCLKGNILSVLDNDNNLVISKLQEYLLKQVSTDIKEHFNGKNQTPWIFGSSLGPVILGTLNNVPSKRIIDSPPSKYSIYFENVRNDNIKNLSGFIKSHTVPYTSNSSSKFFVKSISKEELNSSINRISKILKDEMNYKRREIRFSQEDGSAEFNTPDFTIEISIDQDERTVSQYRRLIKLTNINPNFIITDRFNDAFSDFFDTLYIEIDSYINVDNIIDFLEDNNINVDYDSEASYCSFEINNTVYKFSENQIKIEKRNATPKELFLSVSNGNKMIHELQKADYIPLIE